MEESSHSFSTMGILRLLLWLCSAAPQPLSLFVLCSLPHISFTAASLLTVKLSKIQRNFDAGIVTYIVNYILAWKILQWNQSFFPATCCFHYWSSNDTWYPTGSVYILYILQYIFISSPPAKLCPPYKPSTLIIDFYISSLFPYATSLIEITDLFVEPLTTAGNPASPINPMFSSSHWEKTYTDTHKAALMIWVWEWTFFFLSFYLGCNLFFLNVVFTLLIHFVHCRMCVNII